MLKINVLNLKREVTGGIMFNGILVNILKTVLLIGAISFFSLMFALLAILLIKWIKEEFEKKGRNS